jgi:hypothetical protein
MTVKEFPGIGACAGRNSRNAALSPNVLTLLTSLSSLEFNLNRKDL